MKQTVSEKSCLWMKRTAGPLAAAAAVLVLLLLVSPLRAMSEKDLSRLYLDIVEDSVKVFDPLWTDDSKRIPNSGFFDFRKYPDWTPDYKGYAGIVTVPGNGMIGFCYAVLLTETDKPYFTDKRIPRSLLMERLVKMLRWCALTSVYVKNPYPYIYEDTAPQFLEGKYWRRSFGYRADEVGFLTLAAAKIWKQLDRDTQGLIEEVMVGGAPKERLVRHWYPPQGGNQDQVKQDLSSTMGAAFMFPQRADSGLYLDIIRGNGLDMVSTLHDFANPAVADGKKISEWAKTWDLYQDYTGDHHGWAHIWYGVDKLFEGRLFIEMLGRWNGIPVPQTFTFPGNGFDGILDRVKNLSLPEGEPVSVHGMEYDSYFGGGLLAYCYGAVMKKDPLAASFEERAAILLKNHTRAMPEYDYHRNDWGKAALAYLVHKYDSRAEPVPFAEAWSRLKGTFHHPWQRNLLHRDAVKVASFSWGTISSKGVHFGGQGSGVCGFVVPARSLDRDPEPLIYLHPLSITGELKVTNRNGKSVVGPFPADTYRFHRDDAGFRTVGIAPTPPVEQTCAFFSFADGPAVFFNSFRAAEACRINWSGMPVYFFVRPGMTSARVYSDAENGKRPLEKPLQSRSGWWSVDESLGVAAKGGTGRIEVSRQVGRNWARTDAYKDKCDVVSVSPIRDLPLAAGERAGKLASVFYANAARDQIEKAGGKLQSLETGLPRGWAGIVAADVKDAGRRYLAVANLDDGETEASVTLAYPEGAPLFSEETVVEGKNGRSRLRLNRLDSYSDVFDGYLEALDNVPVVAWKSAAGRYQVRPVKGERARIRIRYFGPGPKIPKASAPNGQAVSVASVKTGTGEGYVFEVGKGLEISFAEGPSLDRSGPAVEIGGVTVREDSRLSLEVEACDQSGIEKVSLFQDGKPLGEKTEPPFIWSFWPESGYHTYYAVAADRSVNRNERRSDARTVLIPAIERPDD